MTTESFVLLDSTSAESEDLSTYSYSEKQKGAGYNGRPNPVHTVLFQLNQFKGSIKIQGTLEMYPGDSDWVDIDYDSGSVLELLDSTAMTTDETRNFTGNWLWIRVAYILEQGTIVGIRYNF